MVQTSQQSSDDSPRLEESREHAESKESVLPRIMLVRHGETAWSAEGRHTGRADLPLTPDGLRESARLQLRLSRYSPDHVFTSPLLRARETAQQAGYSHAEVDEDLTEWNYGTLEGLTLEEIQQQMPGWSVFRNGGPRGESVEEVMARADRVVARLRLLPGNCLIFTHGHFSRALAARWCGLDFEICPYLMLRTTALSVLGYDRDLSRPAIHAWNVRESFPGS